jgi:hypothetical protein
VWEGAQLLVDHADAARLRIGGRGKARWLAIEQQFAAVIAVDAREQLHHGAFAGAIFANQAVYLAGQQIKVDAIQRDRAAVALGDCAQLKDRGGSLLIHRRSLISWMCGNHTKFCDNRQLVERWQALTPQPPLPLRRERGSRVSHYLPQEKAFPSPAAAGEGWRGAPG